MRIIDNILSKLRKEKYFNSEEIISEKQKIRSRVRKLRETLDENDRNSAAEQVFSRIENCTKFKDSKIILMYWSLRDELPTHAYIDKWCQDKTILLPVVNKGYLEIRKYVGMENMKVGEYGIFEPIGQNEYKNHIDMAIVPGVAFDSRCRRVGRGKGYYDRFLKDKSIYKIGVGYDFQYFENLPTASFDIFMDNVVTPNYCPLQL